MRPVCDWARFTAPFGINATHFSAAPLASDLISGSMPTVIMRSARNFAPFLVLLTYFPGLMIFLELVFLARMAHGTVATS